MKLREGTRKRGAIRRHSKEKAVPIPATFAVTRKAPRRTDGDGRGARRARTAGTQERVTPVALVRCLSLDVTLVLWQSHYVNSQR